ncbi:MAG: carbohydrate ABC transporter permease, partial [Clostridiales bacterium]|nr:carbohydrate ABC transporter permease [Clostridiales bacterium]
MSLLQSKTFKRRLTTGILLFVLSCVAVTMIFPYLWMLSSSFKRGKDLFTEHLQLIPPVWEFENYSNVIFEENLLRGFFNTAKIFVFVLPIGLFATSLASFAFAKMRFRGGKLLFSLLMATMMIPFPAVMMPQYLFFSV